MLGLNTGSSRKWYSIPVICSIYLFSKAPRSSLDPPSFLSTCYQGHFLGNITDGALVNHLSALIQRLGANGVVPPRTHTPYCLQREDYKIVPLYHYILHAQLPNTGRVKPIFVVLFSWRRLVASLGESAPGSITVALQISYYTLPSTCCRADVDLFGVL